MTLPSPRLAVLDNARALLSLLGIPFHALLFFCLSLHTSLSTTQPTLLQLTQPLPKEMAYALNAAFFIHSFWMPCFFLLAGFVARLLYQAKGLKGFIRNRCTKIAIPFLLCWLWKVPLYFLLAAIIHIFFRDNVGLQQLAHPNQLWQSLHDLKDLWFLYDLLWFDVLTTLLVWTAVSHTGFKRVCAAINRMLARFFSRRCYYWLLALCFTALLWSQPRLGYRPLDIRLLPSLTLLIFYGSWYALGWWLQAHQTQIKLFFKPSATKWGLAFLGYALCLVMYFHSGVQPKHWVYSAQVFLYQLSTCCTVFVLLGIAWRYLKRANALLSYLSQASYWLYLVQVPIILLLLDWLEPSSQHFYLDWIILMLVAFALSLGSYQLLVRHTWLNRFIGQKWH